MSGRGRVSLGGEDSAEASGSGPAPVLVGFIGKIEAVTGSGTLTRADTVAQVEVGDSLRQGDIIETKANGQICISFIDGTALNLAGDSCIVLKEFAWDDVSPSALFDVTRGSFSFTAGKLAKAGRLGIDTPVASIRGRTQTGGMGILTLATFYFALLKEAEAASSNATFLDDGIITYKDMEHGVFELTTKEATPRHIIVDDPGETVVLRRIGTSISVDHIANSVTDMARLQADQQAALRTFSLGLQQGPTSTGPGGSSTPPDLLGPAIPIHYAPPAYIPPPNFLNPDIGGSNGGGQSGPSNTFYIPPPLPPPVPQGPASIIELTGHTGDTNVDSTTITLAAVQASAGAPTFLWSGGSLTGSQQAALAAATTLTTTINAGVVDFNFSAPDKTFDFLAAAETLAVTYDLTVTDANGTTSTLPLTITVNGTNDAPMLSVSGPQANTELAGKTGNATLDTVAGALNFTDVDITNTHTVTESLASVVWSGGATLPGGLATALATALSTTLTDSTGSGSGAVGFTFSAADKTFDFLAAGETLTVTYDVTVTDNDGANSTQPVTITITGTNDAPAITSSVQNGPIAETAGVTGSTAPDAVNGAVLFADVDLNDTHTVSTNVASAIWSGGGTLPGGLTAALATALSTTLSDSTGSGSGAVGFTFSAADKTFDFLAAGETLTVTYGVTVTDNNNVSSTQPITVTITGTNDAPTITSSVQNGPIAEAAGVTGSTAPDAINGAVLFADVDLNDTHTVSTNVASAIWSGGGTLPGGLTAALMSALSTTLTDSTGSGSGAVGFTFSAADKTFDFLAAGETLTVTYGVTVTDNNNVSSTQPITVTITGTNDAPVLNADTSGPHPITELAGKTGDAVDLDAASGTLNFTDVDLDDTHVVTKSLTSAVWSGGATLPAGLSSALASALSTTLTDSTGSGSGAVGFTFSAADKTFDFLAAGETLTVTYGVTVTDNNNVSSTQPVTITVTGTNDASVISSSVQGGPITELTGATGSTTADTVIGAVLFTDVGLNDTHTVSTNVASAVWSGGGALPGGLSAALATALSTTLTDSTGSGSGAVGFTFSAADKIFDFLAAGETLTVTYDVTVTDNNNVSSTQPITITITGTNDAPTITSSVQGSPITEAAGVTGSTAPDAVNGAVLFADVDLNDTHTVSTNVASAIWSGGGTLPGGLTAALATALSTTLSDSTGSGSGAVGFTFSAADKTFDFLAAGETLTVTYGVTVTDNNNVSSTQPITVTITGTNDAPTITSSVQNGPIAEAAGVTGSTAPDAINGAVLFADVDLNDTHTVSTNVASAIWSGGGTLPGGLTAALMSALSTTLTDSTGSGSGAVGFTFSAADKTFDFLAAGETLTVTYGVTVTDNNNVSSTQPITVTITGTNDAPTITSSVQNGPIAEAAGVTGSTAPDAINGAVLFADVDLSDTHAVTIAGVTASGVTSGLPADSTLLSWLMLGAITDSTNGAAGAAPWTFSAQDKNFDYLAAGQAVTLTYTVQVTDGHLSGGTATQNVTVTITGSDDAPTVTGGSATVSEEGLPGGSPDGVGNPTDTTNSVTSNGTISASDVDSPSLTMTLGNPGAVLTSGGQPVTWAGTGTHTLVGSVGAKTILTVTIDDAGHYTVTLNGPIDHPDSTSEDVKTISVPISVSDGILTTPTTLSVTVEDDSPKAVPITTSITPTDANTNVMLILDLSGSMSDASGLSGLSRLDVEKAAVNELLEQYNNRGDVMVRLVTFSDSGAANGSVWMTVDAAKAALAGLTAGGSTNYDAGLLTAMSAFTSPGALTGDNTQNVSYFLSDGSPTIGSDWPQITGTQTTSGIQPNEQAIWENFLITNKIISFAIGVGSGVSTTNLDPIAFDPPALGATAANTPIIVTDLNQLSNTLVSSMPPIMGGFVAGPNGATQGSFGGDGGHIQSITINGVTYTFNPTALGGQGSITASDGNKNFTYDWTTKTFTVDTDTSAVGGSLAVVMTTGAFSFQPTFGFSSLSVGYVLVDGDGDTAGSTITLTASGVVDHAPIVRDDHVITNITGANAAIAIPSSALLYNDTDADGNAITVTTTSGASNGSVSPGLGNPISTVTFTFSGNPSSGTFTYTGSTASPAGSDTGNVTVDRSQAGSTLTGTAFGEILIAHSTGTTINANAGNDVLIGGTGNDTLNGGPGADIMTGGAGTDTFTINSGDSPGTVGGSGNAGTLTGYDVVTDWSAGGTADSLNLPATIIVANGTHNNATPSALTINNATIKSYQVTNGIVTFDDAATYSAALTLTSLANVAAAIDFIHHNDIATGNGAAMALVATIGGTVHSYVFEQVGTGPNAANDIVVDLSGVSLSTFASSSLAPAGVSGQAIDLALTNPADHVGAVNVSVAGLPDGWTLSEGTANGDGTWTVQSNDVSALSITAPAGYTGAILLQMSETWFDSTGGSGLAMIANNVEAYAPGGPIFALSGDDNLTGSTGNDLYVFAQPIGHDTIHGFDAAHDEIDLVGYAGFASFDDVRGHLATDAYGDAVITLGDGQSITLDGVAAASLGANNFVFDQTPVTNNAGIMAIGDGAMLPLSGVINNTGTITLGSAGGATTLELIQHGITLEGGGQVILSDSDANFISAAAPGTTFINVDNTISGAGQLVDQQMVLVNEGTIVATGTHALVIDAGLNTVTNSGSIEATGSGGLIVNGSVANSGLIWAHDGNIDISGAVTGTGSALISGGATLEFAAASSVNVTFADDGFGTLMLGNPIAFTGQIFGFTGTNPQNSDAIDLTGIAFNADTSWAYQDNVGSDTGGLLAIYQTNNGITAMVDSISFGNGDYATANFVLTSDDRGGTLVVDPPTSLTKGINDIATSQSIFGNLTVAASHEGAATSTMSVSIGGPGNDNFVFSANQHLGADTIANFNTSFDSIELDGYHSLTLTNLAAAITSTGADALHGDAVINLGHGDMIAVTGVTESYLQQHLNLIHLNSGTV